MYGIKEKIWHLNKDILFTKTIFAANNWLLSQIESNNYEYGHAIYIENNEPDLIIGTIFSTVDLVEARNFNYFNQYIKKFELDKFEDILFALDSYWINIAVRVSDGPIIGFSFKPHPIIDGFLRESRGLLLWHHQLENLYLFYESDKEKAVAFRKDILKRKSDAFDLAGKIDFEPGLTAKDIISERMLSVGTISPNYKEALKLYKYLNKG